MKNIWKWILGIAAIVVVLAALVAAGYFWQRGSGYSYEGRQAPFERGGYGGYEGHMPMMGRGFDRLQGPITGRDFDRFHGRMMGGGGYGYGVPFGGGFFLLGGLARLIPLALVALLVFAAYQMGQQAGINRTAMVAPPEPAGGKKKTS